jgi:chromosomal replication initiation ATPase DnaA
MRSHAPVGLSVRSPEQQAADAILDVVQAHYDVRLDDLLGMRRDGNLRRARAAAAGLLYDCIRTWSTTTIAAYLGRARHNSAVQLAKRAGTLEEYDELKRAARARPAVQALGMPHLRG